MTRPSIALVLALLSLLGSGCRTEPSAGPAPSPVPSRVTAREPPRQPPAASVPRRDLAADEARGGHTLKKHVSRSDGDLRERLARERGISAASTYADRQTAEEVVGATLAEAGDRLSRWVARGGRRPNLALDHGAGRVIGRSLRRGARAADPCTRAVVVLRWDERAGDFYVLTSYPEAR